MSKEQPQTKIKNIKVWDLLKKIWSKDTIHISDMRIDWLDNIHHINWNIFLQSISDEEVYMRLDDITYDSQSRCDYCGDDTMQEMSLPTQSYRYLKNINQDNELEVWDELRPIDDNITIDIITPIKDAILINDTVQHICDNCKNKYNSTNSDDENIKDHGDAEINHPIFI